MKKTSGKQVLVLSGSKDFRLFSARALMLGGYSVRVAKDAKEAVYVVREVEERSGVTFDLVVIEMGGASEKFHDNQYEFYKKNIHIPTLPMYNWGMVAINCNDKEKESPEEFWESSVGNNFIGQIRSVIG